MKDLYAPEKIFVHSDKYTGMAPVTQYIVHPNGTIKHIKGVCLELKTQYGSRYFGFEKAWIDSNLKMRCRGYNEKFEELQTWENVS